MCGLDLWYIISIRSHLGRLRGEGNLCFSFSLTQGRFYTYLRRGSFYAKRTLTRLFLNIYT
jgi:hypothetical protein